MFKVYAQQSAVCEDRPVPRCFSLSLGTVFRFSHNYDGPVRPCRPQKVGEICPLVEKSQLVETQNGTGEGAHARQHRLRNRRRGPARLAAVGAAQRSDTGTGQQRFIAVTAGPNRFLPAGQKNSSQATSRGPTICASRQDASIPRPRRWTRWTPAWNRATTSTTTPAASSSRRPTSRTRRCR
uniref:(northern house mosquito) hypothetical protein n=1 Tax=Culex pipiens TaxID=7175 RepID=A0A8D8BCH4_CULPI